MIRTIAILTLAASAIGPASAQSAAQRQGVLVIAAHPDDELVMAPAIAALAREGRKVTILFATLGDQGPGVSGLAPGDALGEIRRAEAVCSAKALGAEARFMTGLGDGTLTEKPQAAEAPAARFIRQFAAEYAAIDPDLVLTWGPDGGYGHGDHRMVSALVSQVMQASGSEYGARLLYVGIPAGRLPPLPQMAAWAETDPALLTETVRYTPADLAAATAAAQCHETQFDAFSRDGMMAMFDAAIWQGSVHFRPAF